ncbi:hypothetical protein I302_101946 [Kwoniella bestiolae CBS 10118]|uniref:Uncharacterized protein n=1 Tax=Kwoniella bestiolae CBS 10118 TaxID=1296100 RepID=A0A1B9GDT3_9TREE|nr:hypothetical protein I302_00630 [Kwoniella bestiolae CBS 10118]OCF29135.1 hypothetical protein I302_00630 [Kwoniella bestiolae CBS 10118]
MTSTTTKYIPPWQRAGYTPSTSSNDLPPPGRKWNNRPPPKTLYSQADLLDIFNHPQDSTLTFFSFLPPPRPARPDATPESTERPENLPLPPSPPPPAPPHPLGYLVSYVVLFGNAHPAWNDQHEIWTHTNAEKLIEDFVGRRKNFDRPIPVFRSWRGKDRRDEFEFIGWWAMTFLEIVEAQSSELRRMMQAKEQSKGYGRYGRTASAWAESLSTQWIKLKFAKSTETLKEPKELREKQGEKYLLEVGGLAEELKVLEGLGGNDE